MRRLPNNTLSISTKKEALRLYQERGLSCKQIADRLADIPGGGPARSTVRKWCDDADITRTRTQAQRLRADREHFQGARDRKRERALHLYDERGMSSSAVAEMVDVHPSTIKRWCEDAGVLRSRTEAARLRQLHGETHQERERYREGQEHARESLEKDHDPALLIKKHAQDCPYWRGWNSVIEQALQQAA